MSQALVVNDADAVVVLSRHDELVTKVDFERALLAQQHPEDYWHAALEAHAEVNAEYIIFNRFMGPGSNALFARPIRARFFRHGELDQLVIALCWKLIQSQLSADALMHSTQEILIPTAPDLDSSLSLIGHAFAPISRINSLLR